jgi:hypothetical protein
MAVEISIDSTAHFKLAGDREFRLDLYCLNYEFIPQMFAQHGDPDGKMSKSDIIKEVTAYVLEKTQIKLRDYEAEAIYDKAWDNWESAAKNWQSPIADSQTLPTISDPRFAD